jgi:hypothetical protein
MTWSYNPVKTAKDKVRLLIGDTNTCDQLLQDEEISYLLEQYNNFPENTGIQCCELIIAKLGRRADETVGSVSKSFSQQAAGYFKTMEMLRTRVGLNGAKPFAGGLSVLEKQNNNKNPDRVKPIFSKHQFENQQQAPWTSETETEEFLDNKI